MNTSLFELFKIGIGPSSSHTVGPMRAALRFTEELRLRGLLASTASVTSELYGSLALTGIGHATDRAVLLGLMGEAPDTVDPASIEGQLAEVRAQATLPLGGTHAIAFREADHLLLHRKEMTPPGADPEHTHPNGMRFTGRDAADAVLAQEVFYSVGGGFILSAAELTSAATDISPRVVPYSFASAEQLLALADAHGLSIAELVLANEAALLKADRVRITRPRLREQHA